MPALYCRRQLLRQPETSQSPPMAPLFSASFSLANVDRPALFRKVRVVHRAYDAVDLLDHWDNVIGERSACGEDFFYSFDSRLDGHVLLKLHFRRRAQPVNPTAFRLPNPCGILAVRESMVFSQHDIQVQRITPQSQRLMSCPTRRICGLTRKHHSTSPQP